ncbi:MAG TPA: cell division protein ZapA [Polyangiaceae bacterium]|jgi:cell division protein ZapA
MDRRTVELRIAGQSYRLVSSAPPEELRRLAEVVDDKLSEMDPRGRTQPQALLLAALALAHDVENERSQREALERKTRDVLRRVLVRIDDALEPLEAGASAPGE